MSTKRLILNALRSDDAQALFAYRGNPEVFRYQGWRPASLGEAEQFIAALASVTWNTPGAWFQWAIRSRGNDMLVGDLGVHFSSDPDGPVEFGITLDPRHQGAGLATEAARAVFDVIFLKLRMHRIIASVDPRNLASMALLRTLGMRQEAHFRESFRVDGSWVDDVVFALLACEWPSKKS